MMNLEKEKKMMDLEEKNSRYLWCSPLNNPTRECSEVNRGPYDLFPDPLKAETKRDEEAGYRQVTPWLEDPTFREELGLITSMKGRPKFRYYDVNRREDCNRHCQRLSHFPHETFRIPGIAREFEKPLTTPDVSIHPPMWQLSKTIHHALVSAHPSTEAETNRYVDCAKLFLPNTFQDEKEKEKEGKKRHQQQQQQPNLRRQKECLVHYQTWFWSFILELFAANFRHPLCVPTTNDLRAPSVVFTSSTGNHMSIEPAWMRLPEMHLYRWEPYEREALSAGIPILFRAKLKKIGDSDWKTITQVRSKGIIQLLPKLMNPINKLYTILYYPASINNTTNIPLASPYHTLKNFPLVLYKNESAKPATT